MEHLVYCDKKAKVWEKLLSGQKTLIVRGAAGRKLPHSRVFKGEKLYFIENDGSGLITGTGVVKNVDNLVKLTDEESRSIIQNHPFRRGVDSRSVRAHHDRHHAPHLDDALQRQFRR